MNQPKPPNRALQILIRIVAPLVILGFLIPIAFAGWKEMYTNFLEFHAPEIQILEAPRSGIGVAPVSMKVRFRDTLSGLGEVVIISENKGKVKDIVRRDLGGQESYEETINFAGPRSGVEEGMFTLQISARDSSFWHNQQIVTMGLKADYHKPKLELVKTQSSLRHGGSGIAFYRTSDENLVLSGVKIGNRTYPGFPARGIDKAFDDSTLYVSIFALDSTLPFATLKPRVFTEDEVGNAISIPFPVEVSKRITSTLNRTVSDDFIRDIAVPAVENSLPRLQEIAKQSGTPLEFTSPRNSEARNLEELKLYFTNLRAMNEEEILADFSRAPRYESYWREYFWRPPGKIISNFGDTLSFFGGSKKEAIASVQTNGHEIALPKEIKDVYALNTGIVLFSKTMGMYGRLVAIDHGFSIVSLYGNLHSVLVNTGDLVQKNQVIGDVGATGFSDPGTLILELRVQGTPVDLSEWWDSAWFETNVTRQIEAVKRSYGIPILRPID